MIGICGIGAAGNNIADLAAEKGFHSVGLNYSQSDLNSLQHVNDTLLLLGSEGTGKQRELATQLMRDNWESTVEFIRRNMSKPSIDVVMIVFSTGGGSGSGISPLLIDILTEQISDKTIVAVPILPSENETLVSQVNTINALQELSELDVCVLPIDNQTIVNSYSQTIPKNILYKEINEKFINLIQTLVSYTEKSSKNGILDQNDLRQLFSTNGIMSISSTNLLDVSNTDISAEHFTNKIHQSWKKSIFTPIQYENIIRAGVIFDGNESLMEFIRYDKLFDKFGNFPLDLFEGNYTQDGLKVISILSGLSWINDRTKRIDEIIEEQSSSRPKQTEIYKSKNLNKNQFFSNSMQKIENKPKKRSFTDILSKYQQ
ncbi:cell division protein FtsZ [Metabacillus fastidiosus]|uniref:cell division protein FtsZ n=1 Tax=Metabacillus fastidiosus TaxID=1458 RepID=UPI003D276A11